MIKKITSIPKLKVIANDIRQDVIRMLIEAKSGHSAGPLGMADVFTAMYFNVLKHDPKKPNWDQRDRLVLSNGHICPVQYAAMAHAGYFPKKELLTLRKLGSKLQGHPHNIVMKGIETSSGPLGSGLSQSCGMALAAKLDKKRHRIYCLMSDGEHDAGHTWEAAMFAAKNRLNNLTVIIDRNNIQIDGYTEDIMPLEPLDEKYRAFGWHVMDIDGHNMQQIIDACNEVKAIYEKPTCIIAHTIPGKGVDFMEYDFRWHGAPPGKGPEDVISKKKQGKEALEELKRIRSLDGRITGEHE